MSGLDKALNIATTSLRACYLSPAIVAGPHHFTDYWARDAYFGAFGSLSLGDTKIIDDTISLFFSYQRLDGLIPYRIMRGPISLAKYFGKPKLYRNPKPTYRLRGFGSEVLDGTTLTVLFAAITKRTMYMSKITKALDYLETKERHGLLWDGPMAEWNDAVWKYGNLLYSNVIYWYMYDQLTQWSNDFDPILSKKYKEKTELIAIALRKHLWNGNYFSDWHDYKRQDYFYPFGNCLAIAWGLTTKSESTLILATCSKHTQSFTLETNSPHYPWWRVDFLQRLAGMADYQNHGILWWQPITTYLVALKKMEYLPLVKKVTNQIAQRIIADNQVFECHERNGSPVNRTLYRAEHPFAWAAGLIIWSLTYNNSHE